MEPNFEKKMFSYQLFFEAYFSLFSCLQSSQFVPTFDSTAIENEIHTSVSRHLIVCKIQTDQVSAEVVGQNGIDFERGSAPADELLRCYYTQNFTEIEVKTTKFA